MTIGRNDVHKSVSLKSTIIGGIFVLITVLVILAWETRFSWLVIQVAKTAEPAATCQLSFNIRGETDLQQHTHFLRVFTSPSNVRNVQIYFNGWRQNLPVVEPNEEYGQYIDYYIRTTFVQLNRFSWNNTSRWYVSIPGECSGSGSASWRTSAMSPTNR